MDQLEKMMKDTVFPNINREQIEDYPELDILFKDPINAWKVRSETQTRRNLHIMDPTTPITENKVRFVCISDTHGKLQKMIAKRSIPNGDVLLHTGDITMHGDLESISKFNTELAELPHKIKLVIAGNHEYCLDKDYLHKFAYDPKLNIKDSAEHRTKITDITDVRCLLNNCMYIEDNMVEVFGIKIHGTPWVIRHGKCVAFALKRGVPLLKKWRLIPDNVDILMSHCAPLGYNDYCKKGYHIGCVDLLNTLQHRVKPKYHIFGHVHEDYGMSTDGTTTFINASSCTQHYRPTNIPIVFDYPLPPGHSKDETVKLLTNIAE